MDNSIPLVFIVTNDTPEAITYRIVNDNPEPMLFRLDYMVSLAPPGISSITLAKPQTTTEVAEPPVLLTPQEGHAAGGALILVGALLVVLCKPWKKSATGVVLSLSTCHTESMSNQTTTQTECKHMQGFSVNEVEAMGCVSWHYECEDCGALTAQVVEYPEAFINNTQLFPGPRIDWWRVRRIYRTLVA